MAGGVGAEQLMHVPPLQVGQSLGPLEKIVMSCGAGFHEELVFRAILFGGLVALIEKSGRPTWQAVVGGAIAASLLFSGVHYVLALIHL